MMARNGVAASVLCWGVVVVMVLLSYCCGWSVVQADTVILPPVNGNTGAPEKLLLLIIGAYVPPSDYVSLVKEVKKN